MRWTRSTAWASTAGFHQGSSRNTYSAVLRVIPVPPAFSDAKNKAGPLVSLNRSTGAERSLVSPVSSKIGRFGRSRAKAFLTRSISETNWENTTAFEPLAATSASFETKSVTLPEWALGQPELSGKRPGSQQTCRNRMSKVKTEVASRDNRLASSPESPLPWVRCW